MMAVVVPMATRRMVLAYALPTRLLLNTYRYASMCHSSSQKWNPMVTMSSVPEKEMMTRCQNG